MNNYTSTCADQIRLQPDPSALQIARRLMQSGYRAYLAGGCVRDLLLGTQPKDYDVATDAKPDEIMKLFARTIPVGAQFGVVKVVEDGREYDVATFRSDGDYPDSRHPASVTFCGPEEDVKRRDFSINGLLLDPATLKVVDHVGGLADLEAGIVRAIGDPRARFAEDALRMMRAVRFASRLGYSMEAGTLAALKECAARIDRVSAERIRDELIAIITGRNADRGLRLLDECGLLERILPEVAKLKGVEQPEEFHPEGDVFVHTLIMAGLAENPSPELAMGILLHDVGKAATFQRSDRIRFPRHEKVGIEIAADVCRRLRFSSAQTSLIGALIGEHMRFMNVGRMRESKLKRFLSQPHFDVHLELHRIDCLASHGDLSSYEFCKQKLEEFKEEVKPPKLLTGDDLIAMGYRPGPIFKSILRAVEDAALERRVLTREEAQTLVAERFPLKYPST